MTVNSLFNKKTAILIIFLLNTPCLFSQKYNFQNFSVTDGIAQSQIYALMQDSGGMLWIGTRGGGITCYDGKNFKTYTTEQNIGNNYINSIVQDSSNIIWIGNNSGLTEYSHQVFRNYTFKTDSNQNGIVNQVLPYNKKLLLATSNGLYFFNNHEFIPVVENFNIPVRSVCIHNNLIYAASEEGVFVIKNNKAVLLSDKYGITPRSVTYLISDSSRLYIATNGDRVYVYEGNVLTRLDKNKELANTSILHLFNDGENIWISTLNKGIAYYSLASKKINWLTEAEGLCNNHIRCCIKDNAGNYWMGSSGGGISYYKGQQFIHYHLNSESQSNLIYSVFFDSNNALWIGNSNKGIMVKRGNVFEPFNTSNGFIDAKIKAVQETKNKNILIGTDGQGIYLYNNKVFRLLPEFKNKHIKNICKDKNNNIWIATAGAGIYRLTFTTDNETSYNTEHFTIKTKGLQSDRITSLCEDRSGNIWYGTDNNGLGYISNGVVNIFSLKTDAIRGIAKDKNGNLWVATGNGLLSINDKKTAAQFFIKDRLNSNNLYSVIVDDNNFVLVGNEKGFDQIRLNNEDVISDIRHFGLQEGFAGVETTQNAICKDDLGNIWFGTINGLTNYNINLQNTRNVAPKLQINNIRLFYLPVKKLEYDSSSVRNTFKPLNLKHNENHITFDFSGIYLSNPSKVNYQWKLEGLETNWSPLSKQESVTYPNLLAGDYTFYVKALNEEGGSEAPLLYHFSIQSPWWKQAWFTIIWISATLLLFFLIYKWRVSMLRKKLKEQEIRTRAEKNLLELEQKTLRLQMNPHFMFNALNSIQNNIGGGNEQTARYYLAKYSKLMRMVLENSRNHLITLDDEIKMLENYLLLEKFSNNDSFDYEIIIGESIEMQEVLLPPMIIQPFIENSVVHGIKNLTVKGKISIAFNLAKEFLVCEVKDNGVGRKADNEEMEHKSTALVVTQERLDLLQENKNYKTIEIIDLKDNFGAPAGTKVIIKIPLQLH